MMPSPKPSDFPLLLEVFREGLIVGLISINDITSWADDKIINIDEPHYFFIELSLSKNKNDAIEVISSNVESTKNPICARVLMALIHKRLVNEDDVLTIEPAAKLVGTLQSFNTLTMYELNKTYTFDDYDLYYLPDLTQLQKDVANFLSLYKSFNLKNYNKWEEINIEVLRNLKEEEAKIDIVNASILKIQEKREKKLNNKAILVLISILSIVVAVALIMHFMRLLR
jgi:hypothetical protein